MKKSKKADSASQVSLNAAEVFALPGLTRREIPPVVGAFVEKMAGLIAVPRTSRELLDAFAGIDVKAEEVARLLRANSAYEFIFMRAVQALAKREQPPELETAVVLMGMQHTRNFVVALQLHRQVKGVLPEFDADGKPKIAPREHLKYALRTEEVLGAGVEYADTAYMGGLLFDLLALTIGVLCPEAVHQKGVATLLEEVYVHGLVCARLGTAIAAKLPDFSARKYVFSACLLHDIGKVAMAILDPEYLKFLEALGKTGLPRTVRQFAAQERFGITHASLSGWIVRYSGLLREIELALEFHHDPALLRAKNKGMHQLASVVSLTTQMVTSANTEWKTPDIADLKIDLAALEKIKSGKEV